MPTVRRKQVALLRADADVVNRLDAGVFELGTVRCREVQQQPVARALLQESRVKPRLELRSDLVAARADARSDAGEDVPRAVLLAHEFDRRSRAPRLRSPPTGMDQS